MKLRLAGFSFLLASLPVLGQGREVSVRLYWVRPPVELQIVPREGGTGIRACPPCDDTKLANPVRIKVEGERVELSATKSPADSVQISGSYLIEVQGNAPLASTYPLEIRAARGRLLLTLRLPLEDYVAGVLAGESSNFSAEESLKAMAVAVRTYAIHYRGRHQAEGFDFCDTTHCQDFRLSAVSPRLHAPVEATEGELLWYEGQPASTYYHRNCGGMTEASHYVWSRLKAPYLRQQRDTYCVARDQGEWQSEIGKEELRTALKASGIQAPLGSYGLAVLARTPSGRVERVKLTGDTSVTIAASALRFAVGRVLGWNLIRSELYEARDEGDRFVFHGYGAGHGVGLCQTGAAKMGEEGKSYRQILEFYYPGTALGLTARGFSWQALAGERGELLTTRPREDQPLLALAERLMREAEQDSGWDFKVRLQLKVYPTVASFRDATGLPGWVAAGTRGRVIRLQPSQVLRSARTLDSTLRHELLHLLVESRAQPALPLWFREGVVLYLADTGAPPRPRQEYADLDALTRALRQPRSRAETYRAYDAAQWRVKELVETYGRGAVLGWVERGLPAELLAGWGGSAHSTEKRE